MPEIEIIIHEDGSVTVEGVGFVGPDCEAATRFLEEALGEVKERRRKPEYYQRRKEQNRLRQGGG